VSAARVLAVKHLIRVERDQAFLSRLGPSGVTSEGDARSVAEALELSAGVTRWRRWLDFVLSAHSRRPVDGLDPGVRQVLRVAAYELLISDTPPHAAVHQAVSVVRDIGVAKAAPFVNGVLRQMLRAPNLPDPNGATPEASLALRLSHPDWIAARWVGRFGYDEARDLMSANNQTPTFGLRVNADRISVGELRELISKHGVSSSESGYLADFLVVNRLQPVIQEGLLSDGTCAVQDEAAALIVRLLDPRPGESIVDACAAPGGKALYAASLMGGRGVVHAVDINERRLGLLSRSAKAFGLDNISAHVGDFGSLAASLPASDRVLLDAPCTGLGVLRRRPELRWNRSFDDLQRLVELQQSLLTAAARVVRPGGVLVYGTCTTEPEENEEQVEAFLSAHPNYRLESAASLLPEAIVDDNGYYVSLPHRTGMDGAFAARMIRWK
jgi:16S rRNA (cytosine967-C5)-methyltransferase